MRLNVNDVVRVRLTDRGRELHRKQWHADAKACPPLRKYGYHTPVEDADGWSNWQLWHLMETFGPHTSLAQPPCFETTIEIPDGG